MSAPTYNELINQAVGLYHQGRYSEAYELVTDGADAVRGNRAQLLNLRFCLACRTGRTVLALEIMREAVIEEGFWYSYRYLMDDEDLAPLRDDPAFNEMAEMCREREELARSLSEPRIDIVLPARQEGTFTLLMALHGNEENDSVARSQWAGPDGSDCLMAFPRSSQVGFSGGYYWNDVPLGLSEVRQHLDDLVSFFPIGPVVLAGFSAGARVALHLALEEEVKLDGLIMIAPWLPDLDSLSSRIHSLRARDVRCWVLWGDQDRDCGEQAQTLTTLLDIESVRYRKSVVTGMGHDVPADLPGRLPEMLSFIKG